MDYFWRLKVTYSMNILLCVLICFVQLNESATYDDLKVACGIKYKPMQDVKLNTIPDECTSIILNHKDFPNENAFNTMMDSPRNAPVFLIADDLSYDSWLTIFKTDPRDIVQKYMDMINKYNLDGLFFDNLFPDQTLSLTGTMKSVISTALPVFLKTLRIARNSFQDKTVFIGIAIPSNSNAILNGLSYYYLDELIDAYILYNATNYFGKCTVHEGPLSSTDNNVKIANALNSFQLFYMNKKKVIMELQLYVKDAANNQELSYGETCHLCPGTKVCRSSLKSIYQKARLMNDSKLGGAYIRYSNQDDLNGQCYCGENTPFPGVKAIAAAVRGEDVSFVECPSYGVPGVYWPNGKCGYPNESPSPDPDDVEPDPNSSTSMLPDIFTDILNG